MVPLLVGVIYAFTLFLPAVAAPYGGQDWYAGWGNRHRSNSTLGCAGESDEASVSLFATDSSALPFPLGSTSAKISSFAGSTALSSDAPMAPPDTSSPISIAIDVAEIANSSDDIAQSSTSEEDKQAWLEGHNSLRQQRGAPDLTWSDSLASIAQSWANGCVFKHSGEQYGENLYAGTGTVASSDATSAWGAEASEYDPSNPTYSHFTQMVWKATKEVGCAAASCDGIFDASYGKATYYVCEYNPAGNVSGEFGDNVQA